MHTYERELDITKNNTTKAKDEQETTLEAKQQLTTISKQHNRSGVHYCTPPRADEQLATSIHY